MKLMTKSIVPRYVTLMIFGALLTAILCACSYPKRLLMAPEIKGNISSSGAGLEKVVVLACDTGAKSSQCHARSKTITDSNGNFVLPKRHKIVQYTPMVPPISAWGFKVEINGKLFMGPIANIGDSINRPKSFKNPNRVFAYCQYTNKHGLRCRFSYRYLATVCRVNNKYDFNIYISIGTPCTNTAKLDPAYQFIKLAWVSAIPIHKPKSPGAKKSQIGKNYFKRVKNYNRAVSKRICELACGKQVLVETFYNNYQNHSVVKINGKDIGLTLVKEGLVWFPVTSAQKASAFGKWWVVRQYPLNRQFYEEQTKYTQAAKKAIHRRLGFWKGRYAVSNALK